MAPRSATAVWPTYALIACAAGLVASLLFQLTYRPADAPATTYAEPPDARSREAAASPAPATKRRAVATHPTQSADAARSAQRPWAAEAGDPEEALDEQQREQAASIYAGIKRRLQIGPTDPDLAAEGLTDFLSGTVQALENVDIDMLPALADHMDRRMCDPQAPDHELAMLTRMSSLSNQLKNEKGLTCLLRRGKEDVVLWRALDAWSAQNLPRDDLFRELASTSRDERTLARLHGDPRKPLQEQLRDLKGEPTIIELTPTFGVQQ